MKHIKRYWHFLVGLVLLLSILVFFAPDSLRIFGLAGGGSTGLDTGSQFAISERLYAEGRPSSGERGTVRDFASWKNCLYVSYATLRQDYFIDVWNIADKQNATLLAEHHIGSANDDAGSFLPSAHLKSPRDMTVTDSHLVFWSNNQGIVYPLNNNCSLGTKGTFSFSNGVTNTQSRLFHGGNYTSSSKFENLATHFQLINLQDPTNPFLHSGVKLQTPLAGAYQGRPATLKLSQDKSEIEVSIFEQQHREHVRSFWGGSINALFNSENLNISLRQLISRTLSNDFVQDQQDKLLDLLIGNALQSVESIGALENKSKGKKDTKKKKKKGEKKKGEKKKDGKKKIGKKKDGEKKKKKKKDNDSGGSGGNGGGSERDDSNNGGNIDRFPTLSEALTDAYAPGLTLQDLFRELKIRETDSLKLALEKAIVANLPDDFDETVAQLVMPDLITQFNNKIFRVPNLPLSDLTSQVRNALDTGLSTDGLVRYTVNKIFAPFVNNAPYMNLTAGQLLDGVVNNPAANTIDSALAAYRFALSQINSLVPAQFSAPRCFQIPRSSRDFLDIALVDSGPRVTEGNPAFFELLKIADFYFGGNNFNRYKNELTERIGEFHSLISNEFVSQLSAFRDLIPNPNANLNSLLTEYASEFSLKNVTAKIIAEALIRDLQRNGLPLDPEITVSEFFEEHNLKIQSFRFPFGQELATIRDLISLMQRFSIADVSMGDLLEGAKNIPLNTLRSVLTLPLEQFTDQLVGAKSLDITLNDAIHSFIIGRMNPHITGDMIEDILGEMINKLGNGIPLPGVLGSIVLAAQGDCISKWIVAYDLAAGVAAGLQLLPLAANIEAASIGLQEALEFSAEYALKAMLQGFVSAIFNNSKESYPTWYTALERVDRRINIRGLGERSGRIVDTFLVRNKVVTVFREMGSIGVLRGENREVTLLMFDPLSPEATKAIVSLGDWQSVTSVRAVGDTLLVVGTKFLPNANTAQTVVLVDLENRNTAPRFIYGSDAVLFSAVENLKEIRNGEGLGIISQGGGIVLFE